MFRLVTMHDAHFHDAIGRLFLTQNFFSFTSPYIAIASRYYEPRDSLLFINSSKLPWSYPAVRFFQRSPFAIHLVTIFLFFLSDARCISISRLACFLQTGLLILSFTYVSIFFYMQFWSVLISSEHTRFCPAYSPHSNLLSLSDIWSTIRWFLFFFCAIQMYRATISHRLAVLLLLLLFMQPTQLFIHATSFAAQFNFAKQTQSSIPSSIKYVQVQQHHPLLSRVYPTYILLLVLHLLQSPLQLH